MKIQYDKEADALYIYLSTKKVASTKPLSDSIVLDYDSNDGVIGIEMLNVSSQIPKEFIEESLKNGIPVFA